MKNIYFLDTSYILALEIKNEDAHQKVLQNWATLIKSKPFLITTTYIFDEVVTFFNSRNLHYKAVEVGNRLLQSPDIELIEIDQTLFNQGWEYFQKHKDKSYSFTDCLSFIVMQQREIVTALIIRMPRGGKLTSEQKKYNRKLNKLRVVVEHVHRRLKIFKILSYRYRNRHRRFGLRSNLIAGIYNYELSLKA